MEFYNTVRLYQEILDPSAYFLTAWLPDSKQMRKRGIVADYLRRPTLPENLALENMLVESNLYLLNGQYERTAQLLNAANAVLNIYPRKGLQGFFVHPLAMDYLSLVEAVLKEGYVPERIKIESDIAQIQAIRRDKVDISSPTLSQLVFIRVQDRWNFNGAIEAQSGELDLFPLSGYGQVHSQPNNVSNGGSQYRSRVSN